MLARLGAFFLSVFNLAGWVCADVFCPASYPEGTPPTVWVPLILITALATSLAVMTLIAVIGEAAEVDG